MEKLTAQEIMALKVVRANFTDGNWKVSLKSGDNKVYTVDFQGTEAETDNDLLIKSHVRLLNIDKQAVVVPPVQPTQPVQPAKAAKTAKGVPPAQPAQPASTERTTLVGQSPKIG